MTAVVEVDQSTVPGALEEYKTREIDGLGLIEFEQAPSGWLTKAGEVRKKDWRAYHYTPLATVCGPCEGSGRIPGKRDGTTKQCPTCKATGNPEKRDRFTSVTTALDDIVAKKGLPPWSEARGIEGAIEAVRLGLINPRDPVSVANAIETVRKHRLGADRARDDAADRGLNVHACLEHYMLTGSPPNPINHPEAHWGYLRALTRWLVHADPEPVAVEQLVVHPEDHYAGRLDLRAYLKTTCGALTTVDAKTQEKAGIYLGAHAQVNLYERAARRCGDEPADRLVIVVFAADGEYREMPADHPDSFTDAALAWLKQAKPVDSMCERHNRRERDARKPAEMAA